MSRNKSNIFLILFIGVILIFQRKSFACLNEQCSNNLSNNLLKNKSNKYLRDFENFSQSSRNKNLPLEFTYALEKLLDPLLILFQSNSIVNNKINPVLNNLDENESDISNLRQDISDINIESDIHYMDNDNSIAEGDVVAFYKNSKLKADKIIFNKNTNIIKAIGNISFFQGKQFFEADSLIYNLKTKKGNIENVYGVIDIDTLISDMKLRKNDKKNEMLLYKENQKSVSDVKRKGINIIEAENKLKLDVIKIKMSKVSRWRFKADLISFDQKKFTSDKVFFTNDPFNKPQFVLESRQFSGTLIEDKVKLVGESSFIILDDILKLPIGRREIYDEESFAKWGFGYDKKEYDGLFIYRNFNRYFSDEKIKLKLKPKFLIQRIYKGKTSSFIEPNKPLNSGKVENKTDFGDYFALDSSLDAKIGKWTFETNNQFNSLNLERLNNAIRSKISLSRRFNLGTPDDEIEEDICEDFENNKKQKLNFNLEDNNLDKEYFLSDQQSYFYGNDKFTENKRNNDCRLKNKNTAKYLDFSIYNTYRNKIWRGFKGESEIINSFGVVINNRNRWDFKDDSAFSYTGILDFGNYRASSSKNNQIESRFRGNLSGLLSYSYPFWKKKNIEEGINDSYGFTPTVINQGIYLNSSITLGNFIYSDGSSQAALGLNLGPIISLGEFKRKLFDFTQVSANFNKNYKTGSSPFGFDNISDSANLSLSVDQQILGPLVVNYRSYMNLDQDSSDYGKFINPIYSLNFSRRAYSLGAYYIPKLEVIGVKLQIFNFGYNGLSNKF